jgi:serine/threonine protein kinase
MIGTTVLHYRITGKLGVGGMGVVYDAVDDRLDRAVALKFLPHDLADDADASRRLQREAQTLAHLSHANICTVYDIQEHAGAAFMVMERCDGMNLKAFMARTTLTTHEIVDIAGQVAAALDAAHKAGVVHRDIKPGNIMVGSGNRVKVLDFGLARRFMLPDSGVVVIGGSTIPGRPVGTANYMAPERILQLPLDPRSDLFSVGVVMYEMATGRLPFGGASPSETVTNILENHPTPLVTLSPDRPVDLERIVSRLLAKAADGRYQSAAELREDLRSVTAQPGLWRRLFGR